MWTHLRAILCIGAIAGFSTRNISAKEEKVKLDQVPVKVVEAMKSKWPKAEIVGIEREEEDGKTIYEFGLKHEQQNWDASYLPDGKLVAVEEVVNLKQVPNEVKESLRARRPSADVLLVEQVKEYAGTEEKVFYEFKIQTKSGGLELKFDAKGKLVGEEEKQGDQINE